MQAQHQILSHGIPEKYHVYPSIDSIYPPHWHGAIELVYAIENGIGIGINGAEVILEAGDIGVINGDDIHWFLQQPKPLKRWIIQIETSYFFSYADYMANKIFTEPLIRKRGGEKAEDWHGTLETFIANLIDESQKRPPGYTLAMEGEINRIMVWLMRHMPCKELESDRESKRGAGRKRLTKVLRFLEENYGEPIRLGDAAKVSHYSDYHFSRYFKEATGLTFNRYLNRLRISKASVLLAHSDRDITDISFETGFGSVKSFNRVFKEINGCSPSLFRKTRRQSLA